MSELAARKPPGLHVQPPTHSEMPVPSEASSADDGADAELARISKENADLKEALRTRTVIGQATGLLMARLNLTPDVAFAVLVKRSSYANRKVRDIAAEIVASAAAATTRESLRPTNLPESLLRSSDLRADEAGPRVRGGQARVRSCEDSEE